MTITVERKKADAVITMRIATGMRDLIDSAAAVQGKSRTEFMVESARVQAIDVLLDQRIFSLDPGQSAALADILANPPRANDALRDLMRGEAPWA